MKLCIIYNFTQKYREGIFSLIEQYYDCHWVFGQNKTDIKGLSSHLLSDVEFVKTLHIAGPVTFQRNVLRLISRFDSFLMLGELFSLSTWMLLIIRRCFFRNKKIYLWSHGWYGREGLFKRILKRWFFSMSDGVLLYGNYAMMVAKDQGYEKKNLHVIHNSLDYNKQLFLRKNIVDVSIYTHHFRNYNPVLLFIGRLTKVKHLDMFINAVSLLRDRGKDYNMVFVGDGEERTKLEQLVKEKQLEEITWFYGTCYDEEQNAPLIYNADLCVSPGNVGLTAMHCMVYGTPVVTHNNFPLQMPEFEAVKPGLTGDFFSCNDIYSLASTIEKWFNQPYYNRQSIRKACCDEIDNYWTPSYQMNIIKKVVK